MKHIILLVILTLAVSSEAAANFTIAGTVTEKTSGEYAIGATVGVYTDSIAANDNLVTGTFTNKYGFFSIPDLEMGEYWLFITGIGYEIFQKRIAVKNEDLLLNIQLESKDIRLQEVIVEEERTTETREISTIQVSPDFVSKMPSIGGEIDVFRTLQLLPGVQQSTELSSGLYVRGGSPDQNLVLLDGVIVYNPTHLGGFLSSFNSDALRDVKLIKGALPAEYGGRLSSVIDLSMKEGTKEDFSGSGALSMISSKLTLEGPINDNSTFMVSGRRMYLDLLLGLSDAAGEEEDYPDYYFYDLNAKVNYKLGENDRIFASGYFARDVFGFDNDEEFETLWGNSTSNLRWMHIFSPKLFSNFSMIYTDYLFETTLTDDDNIMNSFNSYSQIKDFMLRGNLEYHPGKDHKIKAGMEVTNHQFNVKASTSFEEEFNFDYLSTGEISTLDAAFYVQDEWNTGDFTHNLGFRGYYFQEGNYFDIEPRLSSVYQYTDDLSFKASFDIAHQYLHLVTRNDINLPTDLWFPSTKDIKPQKGFQFVLGAEKLLFNGEYLVSVEGYYKDMQNLIEFKDNADFNFGMPDTDQFTFGKGRAYGVELFINRRIGNLTGWLGYTLAWTERKFDELNNGNWFPPRYDRRHDISLAMTYNINDTWELGAAWVYGTGQAYTVPNGTYTINPVNMGGFVNDEYHYSSRNGYRMPSYHRMDVNFMYKYSWFGLPFEFSINVYNIYNRKNPFTIYIDEEYGYTQEEVEKKLKKVTLFPIIPTFGLRFKF